ncbi:MAG: hypothetical protein ACRDX8_08625 [Acidimicrobiales bacterium]
MRPLIDRPSGTQAEAGRQCLDLATSQWLTEQSWSPADHDQAVARAWGRVSDLHAVSVWTLLAEGTIDTLIAELLAAKAAVLAAVIDGQGAPEGSVIGDLVVDLARRGMAKQQCVSEQSKTRPAPSRPGSSGIARAPLRNPPRRPAPSSARHPTRNPMEVSR